jgi:branched-chain amino acid transport system substrate-binding protein
MGALFPLTGGAAAIGLSSRIGTELALRDTNQSGGMLRGPVELVVADDHGDPTTVVGEAKRLVFEEKVALMVGPMFSALALAAVPTLNQGKIVSITTSGTSKLTPDFAPYTFSILPTIPATAQPIFDYVRKTRGAKRMALLADDGQNAKELVETIKAGAEPNGIELTGVEGFSFGAPDVTPQLFSLRRTNPEVLVINALTGTDFAHIRKQMDDIGWTLPVAGTTVVGFLYREIEKVAGPALLSNVVGETYTAITYCSGDAVGTSRYAAFIQKLKAFSPDQFDNLGPLNVATVYDGIMLMKAAVEAVRSTDGPAVAAWIEQHSFESMTGKFAASKSSHFLFAPGALIMAEHFGTPESPRPDGLFKRAGC